MNNKQKIRKVLDVLGFCCDIISLICTIGIISLKIKRYCSKDDDVE